MLNGLTKFKQIQGLDAIHTLFKNHLTTLDGQVAGIQIGQPSLTGKVATIPFTDASGNTVNKTLDLSTLVGPDVHVQSAAIAPNSFDIVITETDGTERTVPLKSLFDQYLLEYIKPLIDAKADQTAVNDLAKRVSDAEIALDEKATQASVNALAGRTQTSENKIDAIETKNSEQDGRLLALEEAKVSGVVPVVLLGKATANDGDAASDDVVPANVKHITSLQVNGEFVLWGAKTKAAYFSKDNGATAVTANLGGAKLFWNKSVIDYNLAVDDQIVIVAIV
ncbi:hypothetical protein VB796_06510 [Arcicella sp. LKC2W]|uniref:hypothetical protein n=1 Tax=Arcicella sp. LKC2W TaxID=2984198 RepID=UPI002B20863A|nr:hypothetical protein [Arcicella sp. LKC2W]MEA5458679.1 hypothetical protein [Arcicella sp. LKC2W]